MRAKLKDIRQGRTFWEVSAYLLNRDMPGFGSITRVECLSTPKVKMLGIVGRSYFANFRIETELGSYESERSLCDLNVAYFGYNQHRLFRKKKHAEAYAARLLANCYNAEERRFIERNGLRRKPSSNSFRRAS